MCHRQMQWHEYLKQVFVENKKEIKGIKSMHDPKRFLSAGYILQFCDPQGFSSNKLIIFVLLVSWAAK